jgi:hypothetical protein
LSAGRDNIKSQCAKIFCASKTVEQALIKGRAMAFVNVYMSDEDLKKYQVNEIARRISSGEYMSSRSCTLDAERDIYWREIAMERGDERRRVLHGLMGAVFYWHGHLLWVETRTLEARGGRGEPGWASKIVTGISLMGDEVRFLGRGEQRLPPELSANRDEILKDLYDALLTYKDIGIYSSYPTFELTLSFAEGV